MNLDKRVSLKTAIFICIIPVAIFWSLVLIPGLADTFGILIYLLIPIGWIGVIVLEVVIIKEIGK